MRIALLIFFKFNLPSIAMKVFSDELHYNYLMIYIIFLLKILRLSTNYILKGL